MEVCSWPVDYSACGPCESLTSLPATGQAAFEDMATEYLWRWTGKQFGECEYTLRPCRQDCTAGLSTYTGGASLNGSIYGGAPFTPTIIGGEWFNLGCGVCGDQCGCQAGRSLIFEKPVSEVVSVTIDGEVLDPGAYRVDNYRYLVRQDGGEWPYCQDMSVPAGGENTWSIVVKMGAPVPVGGRIAAGKMACELAKAACGDSGCALPQRWQTISRQGVTISAAIDLFEGLDEGKTGIWLIDSWVASVMKPEIGFSLASPDVRGTSRRMTSS